MYLKWKYHTAGLSLFAVCFLLIWGLMGLTNNTVNAVEIQTGVSGSCTWTINSNGDLVVRPTSGVECVLDNTSSTSNTEAPWYSYRENIKTVTIENKVYTNEIARGLFYKLTNVTNMNLKNLDTSNTVDMSRMFTGCEKIVELDLSSFNTSRATYIQYMLDDTFNLKILDISSFDTTNVTNMMNFLDDNVSLTTIVLGDKTNFHVDKNYGYTFGRGTWKNVKTGEYISAPEIHRRSLIGQAAGKYVKVSDISNEMNLDFAVDYRIENIEGIDSFSTTNPDIYSVYNNKVLAKIPVSTTEEYVIPGQFSMVFDDVVTDKDSNKYNLKLTINNIHLYDLKQTDDLTEVLGWLLAIDKGSITYYGSFFANINDAENGKTLSFSPPSSRAFDVTTEILDQSGRPVDGTYIFSIYDFDVPSTRDKNSEYKNVSGTAGFWEYSEGVNFLSGYDNVRVINQTSLIKVGENRYTGTRADSATEFTEVVARANARSSKYTWTIGGGGGSTILNYYQPMIVSFYEKDVVDDSNLPGAKLELYYGDIKIDEWTSNDSGIKRFLNPGFYTLVETYAPDGYEKEKGVINFSVDTNYRLLVEGEEADAVILRDYKVPEEEIDVAVPDTGTYTQDSSNAIGLVATTLSVGVLSIFIGFKLCKKITARKVNFE